MSIGSVIVSVVFLLMLVSPYLIFKLVVKATEKKSDRVSTDEPLDTPARRYDLLPTISASSKADEMPLNIAKAFSFLLNAIFGVLALVSSYAAFMSFLVFDDPAASRSAITWNFAVSFFVFPYIYFISLKRCSVARRKSSSNKILLTWALFPVAGIAWILVAYWLLTYVCHGNFGCR